MMLPFLYLFPLKYEREVFRVSEKYKIPPETIFAMAKAESNFKSGIVSKKGAVGVMQVLPSTAKWYMEMKHEKFAKDDLLDFGKNIDIGVGYYKYLYDDFKDAETALAAYNAGPNRVKERGWKDIGETRRYVAKVKKYRIIYGIRLKMKSIIYKNKSIDFEEDN